MNVFDTIDKKVHEAFAKSSMSLHMNSVEREDCWTTGREHVKLPYAKETVPWIKHVSPPPHIHA